MSKIKTKELIICIAAIMILALTIVTDVFATSTDLNVLYGNNNGNVNFSEIPRNNTNVTPNNIVNNSNNNISNNTNRNNANTMPNTGVDYSVVLIIAVCGISAVYAYKKIKDYNNF